MNLLINHHSGIINWQPLEQDQQTKIELVEKKKKLMLGKKLKKSVKLLKLLNLMKHKMLNSRLNMKEVIGKRKTLNNMEKKHKT